MFHLEAAPCAGRGCRWVWPVPASAWGIPAHFRAAPWHLVESGRWLQRAGRSRLSLPVYPLERDQLPWPPPSLAVALSSEICTPGISPSLITEAPSGAILPLGRKRLTLRIKPSVGRIRHRANQNDRRNLHRNLSGRVFLSIAASGFSGSRASGGWLCAGADRNASDFADRHPRINTWSGGEPRRQLCRRPRHRARRHHALGRARPPAVATEILLAGGDRQHELRPSPAGRSVLPTARTPSNRWRRPPHRPNHHRASAAAVCAGIPSVAPQRSPYGRRDPATARWRVRWAVAVVHGQAESPSSAAPRPGIGQGLLYPTEFT